MTSATYSPALPPSRPVTAPARRFSLVGSLTPTTPVPAPRDTLASAVAALDEGRLLLALERLESVPPGTVSAHDVDALRAAVRVAVGHLTHARLLAPSSGVVALAAGRIAEVVTTPERVESLAAHVERGEGWAADELAACAEASARTDDRRTWHASERAGRLLLPGATRRTRGALLWLLAAAARRRGDAAAAAAMLADLSGGDPARLPEIAATAVAAGDEDLAARARADAERLEERNPGVLLLTALSRHVSAIVDGDADALRRSALLLAETQRPLLHGAAAERAGMPARARDVYEECGATADAERVRRALEASGAAPAVRGRAWETLSAAELRVVHLVAAGATNRRAAQELYLSPHTVSSHLRHAFEKLGIRSRVELARLHAQWEGTSPTGVA